MKMRVLGIAVGLFAGIGGAAAADLGFPLRPPPPAGPSWSGCSIGLRAGVGAAHNKWTDATGPVIDATGLGQTPITDMSGGSVGGQFGCDMQFSGPFVAGVQGNFSFSDISGSSFDPLGVLSLRSSIDWTSAVTGRLGIAVNNVLVYGRGGGAWAHDKLEINAIPVNLGSAEPTRVGWTAGVGVEWQFAPNWSTFVEVNYYSFGGANAAFVGAGGFPPFTINSGLTMEIFELGVNYRF